MFGGMTVFGRHPLLCSWPIMKTSKKVISNQLGTSEQLGKNNQTNVDEVKSSEFKLKAENTNSVGDENGEGVGRQPREGTFEEGLEKVIGHTVELEDVQSQGEGMTNAEFRMTKETKGHLTLRPLPSAERESDSEVTSSGCRMTNGADERNGLLSPALSSLGGRESDGMRAVADGRADGAMSDEEAAAQKEKQYLGSAGSEQRKEVISNQWVKSQAEEKESEVRARVEAARRVRERPAVFDVAAAEPSAPRYADEQESAHGMWEMEEVEPWPERVDGAALLDELATVVRRFVILPKNAPEALALWCVHTYAFRLRDVSTYLGIESPEKRCGKTTLLTVLSELVHRPVVASNISSPAFFRVIEETRPTLLIDEADTFLQGNDELRGILNSGYSRKTAYVVRVAERAAESVRGSQEITKSECRMTNCADREEVISNQFGRSNQRGNGTEIVVSNQFGKSNQSGGSKQFGNSEQFGRSNQLGQVGHELVAATMGGQRFRKGSRLMRFSCWCPKVVAAIGRLPETLADRCIVIRMQRKTAHEECERLRYLEPVELRRKCARFVRDHASEIGKARPVLPAILNDRAGDIWEPLLALADLAGGDWPHKARQAAEGLTSVAQESSPIGALLWDILLMFVKSKRERLFSRWMVAWLNEMPDRPWGEMRKGKAVDERWLAQQLRPYAIKSKTMWIEEEAAKGYEQEDFKEVFRRYIPRAEYEAFKLEQRGTANARE
jgi:hypothetical protein